MKSSHEISIADSQEIDKFYQAATNWYYKNARELPWRSKPNVRPDSYHVWLSEVMLQQTTVTAVIPYFNKFIDLWPNIHQLSNAEEQDVMDAWAGLGYYSRARNLHKCAQVIAAQYDGVFPSDIKSLKKLPGIGDYTAGAIRSIAFNKPSIVVDGNIERIWARVNLDKRSLPEIKKTIKHEMKDYMEGNHNADPSSFVQSLMDIGATICQPKKVQCNICPLNQLCLGREKSDVLSVPKKAQKKKKDRRGIAFIVRKGEEILIERRPKEGLLAGMLGFPMLFLEADNTEYLGKYTNNKTPFIKHVFTHFELNLYVVDIRYEDFIKAKLFDKIDYKWIGTKNLGAVSFASLFSKVKNLI